MTGELGVPLERLTKRWLPKQATLCKRLCCHSPTQHCNDDNANRAVSSHALLELLLCE